MTQQLSNSNILLSRTALKKKCIYLAVSSLNHGAGDLYWGLLLQCTDSLGVVHMLVVVARA